MTVAVGWKPCGQLEADSIEALLGEARSKNFSFLCVPLQVRVSDESNPSSIDALRALQKSLVAASDRSLQSEWFDRVVPVLPRFNRFLLEYAVYLSVCAILIDSCQEEELLQLLNWYREAGEPFQIWIVCESTTQGWHKWRQLNCKELKRIKAAIKVVDDGFEEAWIAESIAAIISSDKIAHEQVIRCLEADSSIALIQESVHTSPHAPPTLKPPSAIEAFAGDFKNVLQRPLQPLKDHLPAETYRCFEEDPIKYRLYFEAIVAALKTMQADVKVSVLVAGAGRGPLVEAVLKAFEVVESVQLDWLIVLEKNPFACLGLLRRFQSHSRIEVLMTDMRSFTCSRQFHLIVSELLGSFGDNELSPECLWPLEQLLVPERGVMIPQSYTSFLQPAYAPLLRAAAEKDDGLDAIYVAYVTKAHYWNSQPQPVFSFCHPSRAHESEAEACLLFTGMPEDAVVDCLVGYFECCLFGDVKLSTVRGRGTEEMCSWFPALLPLREEQRGGELSVRIKRRREGARIWYEWSVNDDGNVWQNPDGATQSIYL